MCGLDIVLLPCTVLRLIVDILRLTRDVLCGIYSATKALVTEDEEQPILSTSEHPLCGGNETSPVLNTAV